MVFAGSPGFMVLDTEAMEAQLSATVLDRTECATKEFRHFAVRHAAEKFLLLGNPRILSWDREEFTVAGELTGASRVFGAPTSFDASEEPPFMFRGEFAAFARGGTFGAAFGQT